MISFEYKVVPAPQRGQKARGVKGADARFALAIERVMNEMAEGGWEYQRTDTLPCEERQPLGGGVTSYKTMLVFRRARAEDVAAFQPRLIEEAPVVPALQHFDEDPIEQDHALDASQAAQTSRDEPAPEETKQNSAAAIPDTTDKKPVGRFGLSLISARSEPETPAAAPVTQSAPSKDTDSPGPALLARARQLAARTKSNVAAE